jgi:hypothetical protein
MNKPIDFRVILSKTIAENGEEFGNGNESNASERRTAELNTTSETENNCKHTPETKIIEETIRYEVLYNETTELEIESRTETTNFSSDYSPTLEICSCYDDTYINPKMEVHQDLNDYENSVEIPFSRIDQKNIRALLTEDEFNLIKNFRMIKNHSTKRKITQTIQSFSNEQDGLTLNIHISRKFTSKMNEENNHQRTKKRSKGNKNKTGKDNKSDYIYPTQEELDQMKLKVLKQIEDGKRSHLNFCSYQHDSDYKPCNDCKTIKEHLTIQHLGNRKLVDNCYKIFNYMYNKIDVIDMEMRILIMDSCKKLKMGNYYNILRLDCLSQGLEEYGHSDDDETD